MSLRLTEAEPRTLDPSTADRNAVRRHRRGSGVITLTLPYPISTNRYWATRAYIDRSTRKPMAVTYVTEEAKNYKRDARWIAKEAGLHTPTARPIALVFTLYPPEKQLRFNGKLERVEVKCATRMDLDNALKVAIDALKGVAYVDDDQVNEIHARYGERQGWGALVVEISEFLPPQPPVFAQQEVASATA